MLRLAAVRSLIETHGRSAVTEAVRAVLDGVRRRLSAEGEAALPLAAPKAIAARVCVEIEEGSAPSLRPLFNLTGTVLHTNLGRARLAARGDRGHGGGGRRAVQSGIRPRRRRRGEHDGHVEGLLRRLTGAEAASVVNNNAAAVLLTLNTLAPRKEVAVSRGELIEIGGSFRMPDIMARAGCRLREVGTTNRTHAQGLCRRRRSQDGAFHEGAHVQLHR